MKTTSLHLLPATDFEHAQGNYDGSTDNFYGDPVKAAGYYSTHGTLQSVAHFTHDYTGSIAIQATLDSDPATAEWFTVYTFTADNGVATGGNSNPDGGVSNPISDPDPEGGVGNSNPNGGVGTMTSEGEDAGEGVDTEGGVANPIVTPDGSTPGAGAGGGGVGNPIANPDEGAGAGQGGGGVANPIVDPDPNGGAVNPDGGVANPIIDLDNPDGGVSNPIADPNQDGGSSNNDGSTVVDYHNEVVNITGRFTWLRASVTNYANGYIAKVTVSY